MKKISLVAALLFGVFAMTRAQAPQALTFGGGVRLGFPVGDFKNSNSVGIGAELQGEYGFTEMVSGIGTIGYIHFFGKTVGGVKTPAVGLIPFLVGARVYPSENFFIGGQIGYGILTGGGYSSGAFDYQPQIGYNTDEFQVGLAYNGLTKNGVTVGHFAVTGIYKFGGTR